MSRYSCLKNILAAFFCLLFLSACSEQNKSDQTTPTVDITRISTSQIPINKKYIGITQSISAVGIKARVEGFLTKMNFIEGKPVKKNQLLFVIDPRPFEAKLELAQGQYAKSVADKEYQEVQYRRMKDLVVKGDVSQSHFDEVNAKFSEADAQVQIGAANVAEAKINLSYCYMYAPFDGIIGKNTWTWAIWSEGGRTLYSRMLFSSILSMLNSAPVLKISPLF